jgi:deoxyribodipyrimidine photolyase
MKAETEAEDQFFLQLLNTLRQHYSESELKLIIRQCEKSRPYSRANKFIEFVKGNLS